MQGEFIPCTRREIAKKPCYTQCNNEESLLPQNRNTGEAAQGRVTPSPCGDSAWKENKQGKRNLLVLCGQGLQKEKTTKAFHFSLQSSILILFSSNNL